MNPEQQAAIDAATKATAAAIQAAQTLGQSRGDLATAKSANAKAESAWTDSQADVVTTLDAVVAAFGPPGSPMSLQSGR